METQITVILPTYNRRNFLPSALKCIAEQTFPSWRLLVINDGGEEVADIVESFHEPRFEYYSRPHQGKSAALNFGLSLVQSKYIGYMDDDDEVYPEHLQALYDAAEQNHKEFVFSDTRLRIIDNNGNIISDQLENSEDVTPEMLHFYNRINHKQILHTKTLSDKVGKYDERMRVLIDFDFIRRLAFYEAPFHVRKTTGCHFLLSKSNINQNDFASISGLWASNAALCGMSLIYLFEKTPEFLAMLYRNSWQAETELHQKKLELQNNKICMQLLENELNNTKNELNNTKNELIFFKKHFFFRIFMSYSLFYKVCSSIHSRGIKATISYIISKKKKQRKTKF